MMNIFKSLTAVSLVLALSSCSSDDDTAAPLEELESETVTNLYAPEIGGRVEPSSGDFTKFDFETGSETTSETDWDVAFRSTTILVNGGSKTGITDEPERTADAAVYIASGTLASITEVDTSLFAQDTTEGPAIAIGSGNGWYNYTGEPYHLIKPIPGTILVFRTSEGKYAKVEILSYYENAPEEPDGLSDATPYYTFDYVYQPNEGITTF
ncbi:HmuY family protein [Leeuwenhoekiella marinoflava]|uniref:Heme-binding HmuY-like protein n=2 Tax=Leeuwenhoekiella marinoflava TaxID=988 RepID=A0A4V1KQC0_9FLAO|nr:HmuY family protein [Leeuwenhoekiella marinoflava]RXG20882.1 heme-binding HmuY-like protein [Leeuwenhoekiella marinoflava]SHG06312.1 HmuY protein [Leeuwenhoekiella marinoflava DSM 3653]